MSIELRNNPLQGIELGPKLQACSERERIFAFALGSGIAATAADAARLAGYAGGELASRSAYNVGHRQRVVEAIEEVARTNFRSLVPRVIRAAEKVIEDPAHKGHVPLIISLLSKLGYGERTAVDVNVSGEIHVNHVDAAVEDLRRLKEIGVPREKLIETFGFSGLDRYERLLVERDARAPRVIEHKPDDAAGSVASPHNPMDGAR